MTAVVSAAPDVDSFQFEQWCAGRSFDVAGYPGWVDAGSVAGRRPARTEGFVDIDILTRTDQLIAEEHLDKPGRRGPSVKVRGVVLPADEPTPVDQYVPAAEPGLIAALGATWTLMQIPTVATPRQVTGAGGSGRHWQNQQRTVSTIDLRRIEHRDTGATDNAGRAYRHRWYVRGHWREQAHGPRQTLRRPTWIPGYIKGPPGAPLLELERVNVWRR